MSSTFDSHGESAKGAFFESSLAARSPGKFTQVADLNNPLTRFAEITAGAYWFGTGPTLYRSTDDGQTWASYGTPPATANELAGYGTRLFAISTSSTGDIYRSTDSGLNWTTVYNVASQFLNGIAANGSTGVVYACGTGSGTTKTNERSTDAGDTWSTNITMTANEGYLNLYYGGDSIWFMRYTLVLDPNRLQRSTDDGSTWANVYEQPAVGGQWPFMDGTLAFYRGAKSTDSGATWAEMSSLPDTCIAFGKQGSTYYGAQRAGRDIYKSTDSGVTWSTFQTLGSSGTNQDILGLSTGAIIVLQSNGRVWRKG